jgi:hypothetical protein
VLAVSDAGALRKEGNPVIELAIIQQICFKLQFVFINLFLTISDIILRFKKTITMKINSCPQNGQLGHGDLLQRNTPTIVEALQK